MVVIWLGRLFFASAAISFCAAGLFLVDASRGLPNPWTASPWKWAGVAAVAGVDCLAAAILCELSRRCNRRLGVQSLGRTLYVYRPRRVDSIGMIVFGALATAAGIVPFLMDDGNQPVATFCVTLLVTAFGLYIATWGVMQTVLTVTCGEDALLERTLVADRVLVYGELESFAFNCVNLIVNALDTGIHYGLSFDPPAKAGKPVQFGVQIRTAYGRSSGDAAALEELRDCVTEIVATRMLAKVQNGGTVPWVNDLALSAEGVIHGSGVLPYGRVGDLTVAAGQFQLREAGVAAPLAEVPAGFANVYPGLSVLRRMMARVRES
jgi:hypothetical protein